MADVTIITTNTPLTDEEREATTLSPPPPPPDDFEPDDLLRLASCLTHANRTQLLVFMRKLGALNEHEQAVALLVAYRSARRLCVGRRTVGVFDPTKDDRDFMAEAQLEADDMSNYFSMAAVRKAVRGG